MISFEHSQRRGISYNSVAGLKSCKIGALQHHTKLLQKDALIMSDIQSLDKQTQTELEAAAFRTLVAHLRKRTDVQNIDLMNLAGFCRNCLSKYYVAGAAEKNINLEYEDARELVYGMPYSAWKEKYQSEATPEQKAAYKSTHG